MSKITKTQINSLKEFYHASDNGLLKSSDWTTGSGRYTSRKALPPFVSEFNRYEFAFETADQTVFGGKTTYPTTSNGQGLSHGSIERKAGDYFIENPRVQKVLVLDINLMIESLHGIEL